MAFLGMQYLEGGTLAKQLEQGPFPLRQGLNRGVETVEALDKARRTGIVHGDLKPGNIMITKSGTELRDFGLAKSTSSLSTGVTLSTATTQDTPITQQGAIAGTFQDTLPGHVEGKEVDRRSAIFPPGAVLYGMTSGLCAFLGTSQLSLGSEMLEEDPAPISKLQPLTPPALDHANRESSAFLYRKFFREFVPFHNGVAE